MAQERGDQRKRPKKKMLTAFNREHLILQVSNKLSAKLAQTSNPITAWGNRGG